MKIKLDKPAPLLAPVPAAIVSVGCESLGDNIIAVSWIGVACSEPPHITIGIRRDGRFSYRHLIENGEFVVNIAGEDLVEAVAAAGSLHGDSVNKWEKAGLRKITAEKISVPLVAECKINMECVVKHRMELGSHDLFVGEIVAVHADEDVLTDGKIDPAKLKPLAYLPFTGKYYGLKNPEIYSH